MTWWAAGWGQRQKHETAQCCECAKRVLKYCAPLSAQYDREKYTSSAVISVQESCGLVQNWWRYSPNSIFASRHSCQNVFRHFTWHSHAHVTARCATLLSSFWHLICNIRCSIGEVMNSMDFTIYGNWQARGGPGDHKSHWVMMSGRHTWSQCVVAWRHYPMWQHVTCLSL